MPSSLPRHTQSSLPKCPSSLGPPASTSVVACPPSNAKTQDVFNSIVKGRKSWKTLRGGEIVWPPELEAALIEGLEQYIPDDSRETRLLGRFPMRNRYISDYIYQKTGKRRTAKQVGSRLQQLRDTCGGSQLLRRLAPHRSRKRSSRLVPLNFSGATSDSESNSDASPPATPTEAHATLQSLLYRGVGGLGRDEELSNIIYIDLLPENAPIGSDGTQVPPMPPSSETNIVRASQRPRRIRDIDPTVTLVAPSSMVAKSHFLVRTRMGVVYTEVTDMTLAGPLPGSAEDQLLYSTKLVPAFWNELCKSPDPTQFTIIQKVTREPYHGVRMHLPVQRTASLGVSTWFKGVPSSTLGLMIYSLSTLKPLLSFCLLKTRQWICTASMSIWPQNGEYTPLPRQLPAKHSPKNVHPQTLLTSLLSLAVNLFWI
ncbi:hypothetical protein Ac2012v2_005257 [Leucoagaricus gongylophorus]